MTPTDKRLKELIDRWLTSLDLHMQYVELNDSAYNKVQPWPVHDRPTKWVLEMARQKALELQSALEWRIAMGDTNFSETLEQAISLANLVGLQHIKRFVPLAEPERHGRSTLTDLDGLDPVAPAPAPPAQRPVAAPSIAPSHPPPPPPRMAPPPPPIPTQPVVVSAAPPAATAPAKPAAPPAQPVARPSMQPAATAPPARPAAPIARPASTIPPPAVTPPARPAPPQAAAAPIAKPEPQPARDIEATREMPRLQRVPPQPTPPPPKAQPQPAAPKPPPAPAPKATVTDSKTLALVMEDAVRLINWGKSWHELPEAIARLADRPKATDVRGILRAHRAEIEQRAKDEADGGGDDDDKKKKKKKR